MGNKNSSSTASSHSSPPRMQHHPRQHQNGTSSKVLPSCTISSMPEIQTFDHVDHQKCSLSDSLELTHLFTLGQNDKGQLGRLVFKEDSGEQYAMGPVLELYHNMSDFSQHNISQELDSKILKDIKLVASGRSHLLLVTHSNKLFGLGFNNYSQIGFPEHEQYITRLREIPLPEKVSTIDHVAAGWFHSIVVCDKNKVYCSGHSYFDQTFAVKTESSFRRVTKLDFLQREDSRITTASASTFSSSLLVDNWKIYACGEMNANANSTNFLVPGCEIFKKESIKYFKHADKGLVVLTQEGNLYFANKEKPFYLLQQNVFSITPSHMYETVFLLKNNSNVLTECNLGPFNTRSNVSIAPFVEKYGLHNIQIFAGYCFYYMVVNRKKVYSINGSEFKEILNLEGISTSVSITEIVATSDCSYFIFENTKSTASEKLMKSRLIQNEKFVDISITTSSPYLE
ncbi:hypothetical protein FDP41_003217 [Naegleria fowleri]|uniref:Uncharacterized protein n=1 Tax=Naegleria fowleri TaxID=5763 RepID=A0A6A5BX34_NAEFO|nr:uncharacterized protein FDP41_003217 [Naegleria fowleri]KAF0977895.1 hypothetical protein FDP41_003217 [Naegleria fowleri]CAG4708025.1 unnamed protein product [Naegleria fowleri]